MSADNIINWNDRAQGYVAMLTPASLSALAGRLGVTEDSLRLLDVGWSPADNAHTFPERDANEEVVGILRRFPDGTKKQMPGGHRGLCIPHDWSADAVRVYVPEGPSDVAALLSSGMKAVGRPSCTGGVQHLVELFAGKDLAVVIVGENDQQPDGRWPGRDGAKRAASQLAAHGIKAVWTLPPEGYKDVREYRNERKSNNG